MLLMTSAGTVLYSSVSQGHESATVSQHMQLHDGIQPSFYIIYTCAFLTRTCKNAFDEKGLNDTFGYGNTPFFHKKHERQMMAEFHTTASLSGSWNCACSITYDCIYRWDVTLRGDIN